MRKRCKPHSIRQGFGKPVAAPAGPKGSKSGGPAGGATNAFGQRAARRIGQGLHARVAQGRQVSWRPDWLPQGRILWI